MLGHRQIARGTALSILRMCGISAAAQPMTPAPDRRRGEGCGPFNTLVIEDALLIDVSGAPTGGPVNIAIKSNQIDKIGGGIVWTIEDGIVYDAKKLLEDVAERVFRQTEALRKRPFNENAPLDRNLH